MQTEMANLSLLKKLMQIKKVLAEKLGSLPFPIGIISWFSSVDKVGASCYVFSKFSTNFADYEDIQTDINK